MTAPQMGLSFFLIEDVYKRQVCTSLAVSSAKTGILQAEMRKQHNIERILDFL